MGNDCKLSYEEIKTTILNIKSINYWHWKRLNIVLCKIKQYNIMWKKILKILIILKLSLKPGDHTKYKVTLQTYLGPSGDNSFCTRFDPEDKMVAYS